MGSLTHNILAYASPQITESLPILLTPPQKKKYSGWVLLGCAAAEFESGPVQIPFFQQKVTHSYSNFRIILSKIAWFFQSFFKIWANRGPNLGKFWKIDPFAYQILHHFIRGHSYTKRLILLPMLAAHPRKVFCTDIPPILELVICEIIDETVFSPLAISAVYYRSLRWHSCPVAEGILQRTKSKW